MIFTKLFLLIAYYIFNITYIISHVILCGLYARGSMAVENMTTDSPKKLSFDIFTSGNGMYVFFYSTNPSSRCLIYHIESLVGG